MSAPLPRVVLLDDDLLALDKPAGLASIPERDLALPSARTWAEAEFGQQLWVVHRLDKDVSGLLLFARNAEAHRAFSLQFEHRQVHKAYLALLRGTGVDDSGRIDLPLRQFGSGRVAADPRRGKPSVTTFRVLERLRAHTLVEAQPETGRRHQLRAHFFALGHPIAGDHRYGDGADKDSCPRLMLHARAIEVEPLYGGRLLIECPPPELFEQVLQELRA